MVVKHGLLHYGRKLSVFENKILRGIFGPRWDENGFTWLHTEELHILYRSLNIVRVLTLEDGDGKGM